MKYGLNKSHFTNMVIINICFKLKRLLMLFDVDMLVFEEKNTYGSTTGLPTCPELITSIKMIQKPFGLKAYECMRMLI